MFSIKNLFRIIIDASLIAVAFALATLLRLEANVQSETIKFIWETQLPFLIPAVVGVKAISLISFGTYKRFWRYTDIDEIIHLAKALALPALIFAAPRLLGASPAKANIWAISYGVIAFDFLVSLGLLGAIRMLRYYLVEQRNIRKRLERVNTQKKKALLIGGGEAGLQVIKSVSNHPETGIEIIAALDDDTKKHGMTLSKNVMVKGFTQDVKYWAQELAADEIIIAIPSLNREKLREVSLLCNEAQIDVRVVPGVDQLAGGQVSVEQIRKLSMEDLLGREEIDLNVPEVVSYLKGKRVLVTGAGGSIGSELCRQLVNKCSIDSLCLVGKGENSIFYTLADIKDAFLKHSNSDPNKLITKIADIRNTSRMDHIFSEFKPQVVFHAAAHKHVHLMELNACEAFENNVLGTQNIAELSGKHKVENFVLVSTDKAVNPTSIMGSTKSLAEKVTLVTSKKHSKTKYTVVRFGNVLGSRGSVIKVWEKQLREGHSITVTHKDAIRYFMTIPEASGLVIQAAAKAHNGEIMVLDMGEPIKILDLAKQFIHLSGFSTEDVPIEIIGLKEGEKLYEELLTDSEFIDSKLTDKIHKAKINFDLNSDSFTDELIALSELARNDQLDEIKERLRGLLVKQ